MLPSIFETCIPIADLSLIPDRSVQVAAVDGRDLDPENGIYHQSGITTQIWGEIAYQVGGVEGYRLLQRSDRIYKIASGISAMSNEGDLDGFDIA